MTGLPPYLDFSEACRDKQIGRWGGLVLSMAWRGRAIDELPHAAKVIAERFLAEEAVILEGGLLGFGPAAPELRRELMLYRAAVPVGCVGGVLLSATYVPEVAAMTASTFLFYAGIVLLAVLPVAGLLTGIRRARAELRLCQRIGGAAPEAKVR
jgi:hypothetical protein